MGLITEVNYFKEVRINWTLNSAYTYFVVSFTHTSHHMFRTTRYFSVNKHDPNAGHSIVRVPCKLDQKMQ